MYCTRCGKELPEGAEFCPNCGAAVGAEVGLRGTAFVCAMVLCAVSC